MENTRNSLSIKYTIDKTAQVGYFVLKLLQDNLPTKVETGANIYATKEETGDIYEWPNPIYKDGQIFLKSEDFKAINQKGTYFLRVILSDGEIFPSSGKCMLKLQKDLADGIGGIQIVQGINGKDGVSPSLDDIKILVKEAIQNIPQIVGKDGPQGPKGEMGPQGLQGPQGDPGPQGIKGETGLQGPVGPKGKTGIQGLQGKTGPQGQQGPIGKTGPQGPVGPKGETGIQGLQGKTGPQGQQGPIGKTGPQGPVGPKGETGIQGLQGKTGPQGEPGKTGPKGDTGDKGDPGKTGADGTQGIQGKPGKDGLKGDKGDPGPQGIQGLQGKTGPQGQQGPIGKTGPQGPVGKTGPQGPVGPKGETGIQGIQGKTGPQGEPGKTGPKGDTGAKGDPGKTGADGAQGPRGPQGVQGIQGIQGKPGPQGIQGLQGSKGDPGSQGPAGKDGAPGKDASINIDFIDMSNPGIHILKVSAISATESEMYLYVEPQLITKYDYSANAVVPNLFLFYCKAKHFSKGTVVKINNHQMIFNIDDNAFTLKDREDQLGYAKGAVPLVTNGTLIISSSQYNFKSKLNEILKSPVLSYPLKTPVDLKLTLLVQ